jgi:hypothetical protein
LVLAKPACICAMAQAKPLCFDPVGKAARKFSVNPFRVV